MNSRPDMTKTELRRKLAHAEQQLAAFRQVATMPPEAMAELTSLWLSARALFAARLRGVVAGAVPPDPIQNLPDDQTHALIDETKVLVLRLQADGKAARAEEVRSALMLVIGMQEFLDGLMIGSVMGKTPSGDA